MKAQLFLAVYAVVMGWVAFKQTAVVPAFYSGFACALIAALEIDKRRDKENAERLKRLEQEYYESRFGKNFVTVGKVVATAATRKVDQ